MFEKVDGSEGETESSSEDDHDSDDPTAELIRETKREMSSKKRESRKSLGDVSPRGAPKPINEDANLDRLTSLSGSRKPAGRDMSNMECFKCGQKGHAKADCPNAGRGSAGRGRGRDGRR